MDATKKTIVFDFGNVLINLDFETCFQNFERILKVDWSERKLPQVIKDAIYDYDRGLMTNEDFIKSFQSINGEASADDLISAWNSVIKDMPLGRFGLLRELAEDFNLVLLSNINDLHLKSIHAYLQDQYEIDDFENTFFNRVFYSHQIGKRKPDDNIYEHVTDELAVDPKSILFIDDLKANVKAAKNHSWHAVRHKETDEIISMMPVYLRMVNFKRR